MHEYSIVQSLLDTCEHHAREHNAKSIKKIVVKIGVQSGVEPHLLHSAFDVFKEGTLCADCIMEILHAPIILHCHTCNATSQPTGFSALCSVCESEETEIIEGKELTLMQLELDIDESPLS